MSERDPVNILGELIEDAVIRYSGQIGTLASAHVAEEVIAHLRAHPEDAAAVLGGELEHQWRDENGVLWPNHDAYDTKVGRVVGPWIEADHG